MTDLAARDRPHRASASSGPRGRSSYGQARGFCGPHPSDSAGTSRLLRGRARSEPVPSAGRNAVRGLGTTVPRAMKETTADEPAFASSIAPFLVMARSAP